MNGTLGEDIKYMLLYIQTFLKMHGFDTSFQDLFTFDISVFDIIVRFTAAAIMSAILAYIFNVVNKEKSNNFMMMQMFVLIAVAISGAMMIIGSNLARAFGLVGAVSIIRFRLSVKNPRDMAFVLITIIIGMASGLGYFSVAITVLIMGVIIALLMTWIMNYIKRKNSHRQNYEIKITFERHTTSREKIESEFKKIAISWDFKEFMESKGKRTLMYHVLVDDYNRMDELTKNIIHDDEKKITVTFRTIF